MITDIESILIYIKRLATPEEKDMIKHALREVQTPPLNQEFIIQRVIKEAGEHYRAGNKVNAVKLTKDMTGWGLKECKNWCDQMFS